MPDAPPTPPDDGIAAGPGTPRAARDPAITTPEAPTTSADPTGTDVTETNAAEADTAVADTAGTDAAEAGTVGTDPTAIEVTATGTTEADTAGTDATGGDTAGTDAAGSVTIKADASGTDASGTDTARTDVAGTDAAETAGTVTAATGTDATGTGTVAAGAAGSGPTKAGIVAVLGAPNAGKSTLVNRLAGAKVSIVSAKPQTTRFRIRAVLMVGRSQVILTDTPGIFAPRRRLDRAMVAAAWTGAQDADMALLVVDARAGFTDKVAAIVARLRKNPPRLWLVLNKTDLLDTKRLLPLTAELNAALPFEETFMVSAENGDGTERLRDRLGEVMPGGPWLFPEDDLSDLNERMLAAELVREQILRQTHEEVPHHATVETESWQERKDGSVRVDLTIYVGRASQKAILIGDKGARIREIGRRAREELTRLVERPVHLFLNVKDRPGWDEERGRLRALGLEDLD